MSSERWQWEAPILKDNDSVKEAFFPHLFIELLEE